MKDLDDDIQELYELTVKVARRCFYDLLHCMPYLPQEVKEIYQPRAQRYETIFEAASGAKDYRHRLHSKISSQEFEIDRLKKFITDSGLTLPEEQPF